MKIIFDKNVNIASAILILMFTFISVSESKSKIGESNSLQGAEESVNSVCSYIWVNQNSGTTQILRSVKAVSDMVGWTCGDVVRRTTDGGVTWTNANPNPGVINGFVFNIEAIDANTAWCTSTITAGTFIYKTTNGGTNWTQVFSQTGGFMNTINFINSTTGFAQGDAVSGRWSLWKTTDAGNTWDSTGLYLAQNGTEVGWVNSTSIVGNTIWFGTDNTRVYRSTNSGLNWTPVATTGLQISYSTHFNNATLGLAGGSTILRSLDGGVSYSSVGSIPGTGSVLGIDGKDNNLWYIRGTEIYRSENEGTNWTLVHSISGQGNDIDFALSNDCLTGWAVSSTGAIAKMTGIKTGIQNINSEIPSSYELEQNSPNPFNPVTNINFSIPKSGFVDLKVYDVSGKEAAVLVSDFKNAGSYSVDFDASELTSGVYFYKIISGDFTEVKKMMVIK